MSGPAPQPDKIAIIGLGYVGLPLAVAFARAGFDLVGFDIDIDRVAALRLGIDRTGEIDEATLRGAGLNVTSQPDDLAGVTFWIITVPTPVDINNCPDLTALLGGCATVGEHLRPGGVVVIESTVYPGTTEDMCRPVLERVSGLRCGRDFMLGYSPERINPGDTTHGLADVVKIVAGRDAATLERIASVYSRIVPAGLHRAPSIAVAETAKVIENAQRDLNIALMNEVAKICHLLDLSTRDVLAAAGTKWNFIRFHPGLVGGHCVGVDAYYLTARAQQLGYYPEVILAGRRINAGMADYMATQIVRLLAVGGVALSRSRVGVLGLTFKENVSDLRNSAVCGIVGTLRSYGVDVLIHDPIADAAQVHALFGTGISELAEFRGLDAVVLAVPHRHYQAQGVPELAAMLGANGLIVDMRDRFVPDDFPPGIRYWSL